MKPPPLPAQLEDGHLREPRERLCDIDRRFVHVSEHAAFRCDSGELSENSANKKGDSREPPQSNPCRFGDANLCSCREVHLARARARSGAA
jgi:hypothetical protein